MFVSDIVFLTEEYKNAVTSCHNPMNNGHVMKATLLRAGISLQGAEAQHIHGQLFTEVFLRMRKTASKSNAILELTQPVSVSHSASITHTQYFNILAEPELGWIPFFYELVPRLRLPLVREVLSSLTAYMSVDPVPCAQGSVVSRTRLLVSAVRILQSLVLDFLMGEKTGEGDEELIVSAEVVDQALCHITAVSECIDCCLNHLLDTIIRNVDVVVKDVPTLNSLLETLLFMSAVLDPEMSVTDLQAWLVKCVSDRLNNLVSNPEKEKKEDDSAQPLKAKWKGHCAKDDEIEMTEVVLSCREKSLNLTHVVKEDSEDLGGLNMISCSVETDKTQVFTIQKHSMFEKVTSVVRTSIDKKHFFHIVKFFSRGPRSQADWFYKPLVTLFLTSDFCLGRHVLKRSLLYPRVASRLLRFSNEENRLALLKSHLAFDTDIEELTTTWTDKVDAELSDLKRLQMVEGDRILEQGRALCSSTDLELVKRSVKARERCWYDLLCLGLQNRDIHGWWAKGFYQLVWDRETMLSTAGNVSCVLDVLVSALLTEDDHWVTQLYRLFNIMFRRLPAQLQEHIVYHTHCETDQERQLSDEMSTRTDLLAKLMTSEQAAQELTPMLNKLTTANVTKMMGDLLWLWLFSFDTVLRNLVQTAVENKGQVSPVVQVLHRAPLLCSLPCPSKSSRSRLCQTLCDISTTPLTDTQAKHLVQLLVALTKLITRKPESSPDVETPQTSIRMITVAELIRNILEPNLYFSHAESQHGPLEQDFGESSDTNAVRNYTHEREIIYGRDVSSALQTEYAGGRVKREGSTAAGGLTLQTTLSLVCSLLETDLGRDDLKQLQPLCLCVVISDIYVQHFDLWSDGDLDKQKVKVRQIALKCLESLTGAIQRHADLFPGTHYAWMLQNAGTSSWLHTALVWPALSDLYHTQVMAAIGSLVEKILVDSEKNVSGLAVLLHMCSLSERACSHIPAVLEAQGVSVSQQALTILVRQLYKTCLPSEMCRAMRGVMALLTGGQPCQSFATTQPEWPSVSRASTILKDALLGLMVWEMADSSMTHILLNYQSAVQVVIPGECHDPCTLTQVMCDILVTLTHIGDLDLTQILQVIALDVLGQLQVARKKEQEEQKKKDIRRRGKDEGSEKNIKDEKQSDRVSEKKEIDPSWQRENFPPINGVSDGEKQEESTETAMGGKSREIVRKRNLGESVVEDEMDKWKESMHERRKRDEEMLVTLKACVHCVKVNEVRDILAKKMLEFV